MITRSSRRYPPSRWPANLGTEVQIVYADNDAITQSTQILKAIQAAEDKRPDAVVFEPVGGTALPNPSRPAAASAGIDGPC